MTAVKEEIIKKLPGNRWTKGDKDRLYVTAGEPEFGIITEHYKTGNISNAEVTEWEPLEGADMDTVNEYTGKISNNKAGKLLSQKVFIDLKTGKIYKVSFGGDWLIARLQYLIIKAEAEVAAEEEAAKAAEKAEKVAPKTKKEKKLTVEQAVEAIATADTTAKLTAVFEKCTVTTLKVIAKATATEMNVKILSKFKRAELLEILSKHSDWLLKYDGKDRTKVLSEKIELLQKIDELKKSKTAADMKKAYKSLRATANIMPLSDMAVEKILMRGLTACTKKSLVSFLSEFYVSTGEYTLKMKKEAIVSSFFAALAARRAF